MEFDELFGGKPDNEGKLLFRTSCLPDSFAKAVSVAAQKILAELGAQRYAEKWSEHRFPMAQIEELTRLLQEGKRDA